EDNERTLNQALQKNKAVVDDDLAKRKKVQEEELTNLRLAEMERLKRDRANALSELARERDRLGQKILIDVENAAVSHVEPEKWRAAAAEIEQAVRDNLQFNAISDSSDVSPLITEMAKTRSRSRWLFTLQGLFLGVFLWVGGARVIQ